MSQNRHKHPEYNSFPSMNFERIFYSLLIMCLAAIFVFAAGSAQASVKAAVANGKTGKNPTYVLKTNLDAMISRDSAILDWRTQEFELAFDLPANDWYESLDLFLSAYPEGKVARGTPLLISYNGAKPVPIYGRGSRFDAHIRMDTSRIRLSGNSIKISYQTPRNADCLTPDNGQWIVDLSRSKLVARARTKKRAMQISEIEQRLAHPMTAPKRVSITAIGRKKLAYEALAAQGIAQRMSFVPDFKIDVGQKNILSDMQFLIGTHDDIRPFLNNKSILSTPGAQLAIDKGAKPKIVLTAETEEQVLELVRAFATYHMPKARRGHMFLHEFYSGTKFAPRAIVTAGNYKLADIGSPILAPSWRPEPAQIDFNVSDPHASSGVLTLKVLSARDINPKSRLSVKLNDKSIGFTRLNKTSKMVEFRIKPGMLNASDNTLKFAPEIQPNVTELSCQSQQNIPTVMVSNASKFRLTSSRPTPATDLSRLAASGAPFDKNSVLVLTAKSVKDKQATLSFLAHSARQFGPKWTGADYVSALPTKGQMDKNILIIGPNPLNDPTLFAAAPRGLTLALGKNKSQRQNIRKVASTDKFASLNGRQAYKTAARNNPATRLKSGGLAALFPSPYANGRMIGVVSSDRPAKFSSAMKSVVSNDYWNGLEGSVARWDKSTILMAQMATPLPAGFGLPETAPATGAPKFVSAAKNWFASLSIGGAKKATPSQPQQTPIAQPVQTVSNDTQIGVVRVASATTQLRGALPARPQTQITAKPNEQWTLSLPKMPAWKMPSITKLKLKGYQTKRDISAWWNKASSQAFEAAPLRQWWKDITKNPAVFFGLLVFLAFFITALASPMSVRTKKKKYKLLD